MEMRSLGHSDLAVSLTGMGVSNFGMRDDIDPMRLVGVALDAGVNFFDTADVYADGRSEELLGRALAHRRDEAVIATKWGGLIKGQPVPRGGGSKAFIVAACEASLRRLGTAYIDLYQFHHPDPETPIAETLQTCAELVAAGKIRHVGVSNMPAHKIIEAQRIARELELPKFISCQEQYSLLVRDGFEGDKAAAAECGGLGLLPFFPLASGLLTGKYQQGKAYPEDSRFAKIPNKYESFRSERNWRVAAELGWFAREHGHSLLELAFSWLKSNPLVSSIIAGASRPQQIVDNVAATNWALGPEQLAEIDRITLSCDGPAGEG